MNQDIIFEVIGNTGPFSLLAESSCYKITVNRSTYLLECGSPVFPSLGYQGISMIKGVFATHSHEDHKRWFTDLVLFQFYNPLIKHRLKLITSEPILKEFDENSKGAIERSLSIDSKRVVDIPYSLMVEEKLIGPRAKYFINLRTNKDGTFRYIVESRDGKIIGPEKAKIFINHSYIRPRLLYMDDESGLWVEPDSYYPFSSEEFYEDNPNIFEDKEAGLSVRAIKSSAWHGLPTVALKFMTEKNSLLFSADTVYKPPLWKELYKEVRPQNFEKISKKEFEDSSIIYGDINDFIEKTWSRERYENAMSAYNGSVVIHDVARKKSIVHTDYPDIANATIPDLFFTHSPDNLTALRPILTSGKRIVLRNGYPYESVNGELYTFDADIYIHHFSGDMVGYNSAKGRYKVVEKDKLLGFVDAKSPEKGIMRVDLYNDLGGEYYNILEDPKMHYRRRADGRVEEVTIDRDSSSGMVVKIAKKRKSIST